MANKTSTYTLIVDARYEKLKSLKQELLEVEQAVKDSKEIKFEIQSEDLKKMSEEITDIADSLRNLDFSALNSVGQGASMSAFDGLQKYIDNLEVSIKTLSSQGVNLDTAPAMANLHALETEYAHITAILSNGTSSTGSKDISSNASWQKELDSMNIKVDESVKQITNNLTKYQSTSAKQMDFVNQYSNIGTGISSSLDAARDAATQYSYIIDTLIADMQAANKMGATFNADFLKGQGWSDSDIANLEPTLKSLQATYNSMSNMAKIDIGDMGLSSVKEMEKELTGLNQALAKNTYGGQMGDLQKMLDQFANIQTPEFQGFRSKLESFYSDLTDMRNAFDTDTGQLDVDKLLGMEGWDESKLENWTKNFGNFFDNVKASIREFKGMEGDVDLNKVIGNLDFDSDTKGINTYTKQIDNLRESISKIGDEDIKSGLNTQANEVQAAYEKMYNAVKTFNETSKDDAKYKIKMDAAKASVEEFNSAMSKCTTNVQQFTSSGSSGMASFAASVSSGLNSAISVLNKMFGYNAIFREMRQAAQECVSTVMEVDSAMNQLEIVTGATASEMNDFFETAISQAKELGQSVTDVLDSIQVYSRLGYSLEEASELAEYTSILSNVANVGTEEATQGLTSVIKGFDMSVDDAEHVADVLIDIGQSYAVSASEILEAFTHSSAAFGATGTTFEEASAIIAAGRLISCLWNVAMQSIRTRLIARTSQSLATTIIWETNYECAKAEIIARINIWGNPTYFYNG